LDVTLDEESLKLHCIFFNTQVTLLKIVEFGVVVLEVRREKPTLELRFHLLPTLIFGLPLFGLFLRTFSHHKEAYFLSLRATRFTLLS